MEQGSKSNNSLNYIIQAVYEHPECDVMISRLSIRSRFKSLPQLQDLKKDHGLNHGQLPSIRTTQPKYSPSYFMAEVKHHFDQDRAAKQYLALLGAYTFHEWLLLRLSTSGKVH